MEGAVQAGERAAREVRKESKVHFFFIVITSQEAVLRIELKASCMRGMGYTNEL